MLIIQILNGHSSNPNPNINFFTTKSNSYILLTMTTLQLTSFTKLADEKLDPDVVKSVDSAVEKEILPSFASPLIFTGGLSGATLGALSTLFNNKENRTWGNALKRALIGMALGGGVSGLAGSMGLLNYRDKLISDAANKKIDGPIIVKTPDIKLENPNKTIVGNILRAPGDAVDWIVNQVDGSNSPESKPKTTTDSKADDGILWGIPDAIGDGIETAGQGIWDGTKWVGRNIANIF